MNVEGAKCLVISAPEWFRDPVFVAYLNRLCAPTRGERSIATWHRRGKKPGDYSDVFVTFDHYEGSDIFQEPGLEYIWNAICDEANRIGMTYGVIWLKNVKEEEA